ncbi:MAG: hypothetical protein A4E28_02342 [Methanocella sp. PtaU1.Bin125]|nr:MAG: hypothetical protein A4E28_02342 [Methanocella sp. PtaU1.Bin125]
MAQKDTIEVLKGQRDTLKRKLDAQNRWAIRPAALALFVLGLAILAVWLMTYGDSSTSLLILLAGITVIVLAVLLYFLSPARFLRAEVADAVALSGVRNLDRTLSSLLIEQKGIYIPAEKVGATRLFLPASGGSQVNIVLPRAPGGIFVTPEGGAKGVLVEPPGYGLLALARDNGATFTGEGLENEIKDALENGMELAGRVAVKREGDTVMVSMSDLADAGMCAAVRKESPRICTQTGCPVCSFVACMIAEGTGRTVRIESVNVKGKAVDATFRLL